MSPLPDAFQQRLQQLFDEPVREKILAGFEAQRLTSFRINTLLAERDAVLDELRRDGLQPRVIDWPAEAYCVSLDERRKLTQSDACTSGRLYIQNPASMLPPLLLDPQPGEKILDLCAAPGSKTLQMAAMMENVGWISAVEAVKERFFRLRANLERHGAAIVHTYHVHTYHRDGTKVWRYVPEEFDRVLLDAPCSSEGQFSAADPETYRFWSPRKTHEMAKKQKKLLFSTLHCLKPGGTLVYSTCTLAPEENEGIIDWFLGKFRGEVEILDLPIHHPALLPGFSSLRGKPLDKEVIKAVRILPDHLLEGFFACLLRKR